MKNCFINYCILRADLALSPFSKIEKSWLYGFREKAFSKVCTTMSKIKDLLPKSPVLIRLLLLVISSAGTSYHYNSDICLKSLTLMVLIN